jgi:uncharacterized protein (TIGR02147 family)
MKVFEFTDYKPFLREFIASQPKKGRGLVKAIGEHLRIDPSQVSQVLSGSKDFTEEQAISLAKFVGLNELETDYLLALVKIERAGTKELKEHYRKKRDKLKAESLDLSKRVEQDRILSDYEKAVFYSNYLYSGIRLSTSIGEGRTLSEIAERFQITREKASEILNFLVATNLCQENSGRYRVGTQHTHIERGSPFLARHHHNWRVKALERTDAIADHELQFTGPVSISRSEFDAVRELLVEAISNTLKKVKKCEPDDVAVLLIDWFWLNKK